MRILVLYAKDRFRERQTVKDHLYSFRRYNKGCTFVYLNAAKPWRLTAWLQKVPFDAVILHYTFLALRFNRDWQLDFCRFAPVLAALSGTKVLVPHDEYSQSGDIWQVAQTCSADWIYTSCPSVDYSAVFPLGCLPLHTQLKTVFTGYVDERTTQKLAKRTKPMTLRTLDLGYRALESSFLFGAHGQMKSDLATAFINAAPPDMQIDIRLTHSGDVNTLKGRRWLRFLNDCVATPGCLGGSSLLDTSGEVKKRIQQYLAVHPGADFVEVSTACYGGADGGIQSFLLGPRHFECAMTRTCQLLVEGDYQGVFLPGVHYIELKRDFSNISEVMDQVRNRKFCEEVAQQCYDDVVASGKYTYRKFSNNILADISNSMDSMPVRSSRHPACLMSARIWALLVNRLPTAKAWKSLPYHWYCRLRVKHPSWYRKLKSFLGK